MGEGVQAMRELGRVSSIIEAARQANSGRKKPGHMQDRLGDEWYGPGMSGGGGGPAMYS